MSEPPTNRMLRVEHEYVSPACAHRDHRACVQRCAYCDGQCQCVCHHWSVEADHL